MDAETSVSDFKIGLVTEALRANLCNLELAKIIQYFRHAERYQDQFFEKLERR